MISIIVALTPNRVIGYRGDLPWKLSADLKRFRTLTMGNTVIMGSHTFQSILKRLGKPLEGRQNIVLSKRSITTSCIVASSFEEAIAQATSKEIFVIGGAQVFRSAISKTKKIYLTEVQAEIHGDTFFPPLAFEFWEKEHEEFIPKSPRDEYDSFFRIYSRRSKPQPLHA